MSYRNGVYVAFNGCGTAVPTESDITYYDMLKAWKANKNIDFTFVDSHEKTHSVKDTSNREKTLYPRLQERFRSSKLLFLIVTENTKNSSEVVEFEIEQAINTYKIPIILCYTGEAVIKKIEKKHTDLLPTVLKDRMEEGKVKSLFIPFKLKAIKKAIEDFNVHTQVKYNYSKYTYMSIDSWD